MVEAPSDLVVRSSPGRRGRPDDPPPAPARRALRLPPLTLVAHRLVADRAMLAAVLVMTVVATTLVATIPVYNAAVADAGLRASLARATPPERTVVVVARTSAGAWSGAQGAAAAAMARLTAFGADTVALAVTDSYQFTDGAARERAVTALAALDRPDELLTVVDGAGLPTGTSPDGGPLTAALHTDAAEDLGLGVGDRLVLSGGNDGEVEVSVDALFEPTDPGDPRWLDQPTVRDGVVEGESFVEIGPFVVAPADLERLDRRIRFEWRTAPDPAAVGTDDLDRLRTAVAATEDLVTEEMGAFDARVTTELDVFLSATEDRLLSTTTAISAVLLQLVAAALVGLLLAAGVLASARAAETLLSWSRGASPAQVVTSAVVEMAVLAAVATVAGPFLAREVVRLVDRSGVVAVAGLELRPEVVPAAFVVAGVVAALAVAIVAWPVVRSATAHRRSPDRHAESTAWFQRHGIDVGIIALAVAALWQMGSAADTVGGDGIDPNLVVAPGLGVLAASLLALRLIRTGARVAERRTPRGRGLVPAMAAWNLARHPSRVVRPALLTVIALATAVFAATYAASWEQSRRDQADAEVGFDVRAVPDARADDRIDPAELVPEYRAVNGVDAAAPYERVRASLGREEATLVAFDAERMDMVRARDDLLGVEGGSFDDLAADEPALPTMPLDGDGPEILLTVSIERRLPEVVSPANEAAVAEEPTVELVATVVDADGTIQRTEPALVPVGADQEVALRFSARGAPVAAPLQLLELAVTAPVLLLDLEVPSVPDAATDPEVAPEPATGPQTTPAQLTQQFELAVTSVSAGDAAGEPGPGWVSARTVLDRAQVLEPSARVESEPGAVRLTFGTGLAAPDASSPETTVVLVPAAVEPPPAPLPVLVTPELRDAGQLDVGESILVRADGTELSALVAGVIASLPGAVHEERGVLADRSALVRHKWLTDASSSEPTEVVVSTDRDAIGAVRGALAAPPVTSREVTDRWAVAEDRSQDPTTIGIIGGLVTGVGAALVMSILGLVLTAVVNVRQRTAEFAVLRALGQTRRELRRSLLAEVVPVTILSTAIGIGAGVALAWRSLSSLTAAGDGTVSVPDPVLVVPWVVVAVAAAAVAGVAITLPLVVAGALGRGAVAEELRIGAPA